jgi:SAM-dependent methyltransferase
MPNPKRDYLNLLLKRYWFAPPVALWRAVELRTVAEERFRRPILDLGCGDGLIAEALFQDQLPIEIGFDPWWAQLRKGNASKMYCYVQQAKGDAMPYADAMFGTVFSNSVLEHIPDPEPVIQEAGRVLWPGGHFIATVPSDAFRRLLNGYRERMAIGDVEGAETYADQIDRRLQHYHYHTPDEWTGLLEDAGMTLVRAKYYMPAPATARWDEANHTYGISEHSRRFYRWLASPRLRWFAPQWLLRLFIIRWLSRRWRDVYQMDVPEGGVGAGLLIVGEKKG